MKNSKVLGISSSPRKDGNSAYLLEQLCKNLESNMQIQIRYLKDYTIESCKECYTCVKKDLCAIDDDMSLFYDEIKAADVILLASPVFMGGINSLMRAFMERTWHLRKGQLKGKIGSYVIVGRRDLGSSISEMEDYLSRLKFYKISGVIGFGLHKGDIQKDQEALDGINRLSNQILTLSQK